MAGAIRIAVLVAAAIGCATAAAHAQIEQLVSPGPLSKAHASLEGVDKCRKCHEPEAGAFPAGTGTAVRLKGLGTTCSSCHQDQHLGQLGPKCETCHTPAAWRTVARAFLPQVDGLPSGGTPPGARVLRLPPGRRHQEHANALRRLPLVPTPGRPVPHAARHRLYEVSPAHRPDSG